MKADSTRRIAKKILPGFLVLLGIAGAIAAVKFRSKPETDAPVPQPPIVRVQEVRPQSWQFLVRAHGTVAPRSESSVIPQVSGTVVWVSPALVSGGFFELGEPLLRIDPSDYEVNLEAAKAAVARGKSEHTRAKKELERQKRLARSSVSSDASFDDAVNVEVVSGATLREARARLLQAERDMDRTQITAPYTGRVRSEEIDVGQFVSRGDRLAKIYAVDFAEVRLPIPDAELQYLDLPLLFRAESEGPVVKLNARFAGQERQWVGRVVRTEGEIDATSRMIHIVARVDDPYRLAAEAEPTTTPLAVGLYVEAEILGRTVEDVMVLPRRAFREGARVLVVSADHRMHYRQVEVLRWEHDVAIVRAGLRGGELICVSPIQSVVDGMRVRVASTPPAVAATGADQ
ncbi:MAG: efflux RND transporter periplasmic adaptor subunit [Deltaproteobacteria bacterium]|nr:efflux RND transporter periplasmic adaptor subunit [Deltaproteobacteria bacterium]MBW2388687.1 efflux RND transporter periplasmic adaptor subunit [Deltaproteobacteria bacterium]